MYKRILMPIDGSACSKQAMIHGLALAKSLDAKATFLYVLENPVSVYVTPEVVPYYALDFYEESKRYGQEMLLAAQACAESSGVETEVRLCEWSRPVDAIVKAMAEHDLVVMGSHGRTGMKRLLLGSVTEGVMRQSTKPVLVIHLPQQPERFLGMIGDKEAMSRDNLRDAFNAR